MKMRLTYEIREVEPYINWLYFYHAWGLSGKPQVEKNRMQAEALELLHAWQGKYQTYALLGLFAANSDDEDIVIEGKFRLPMLRQQHWQPDNPNLCLADFLRPLDKGQKDCLGAFCTSVDGEMVAPYRDDDYLYLLSQTLADRLAEATAEKLHQDVRRQYWGYAPDESLDVEQLFREEYQGIRPAVGYPSLPDISVNFLLDKLLDMRQIGVSLTETGMMIPHASVSGLMFAHPQARYFDLGKIGEDQLLDYAQRRGIPVEEMRKFLQSSLMKK